MTDTMSRANRILRAIEPLIYARRTLTMSILFVITVFLGWQASQIKPDAGFDKSIPLEHPYMKVYKQYQAQFGGANTVLVALIQKNGDIYNKDFLGKLKQLTDAVFFLPGIDRSQVHSLFTPDVRFIEVVEGGFFGANVIPAEYSVENPSPEMLEKVRVNVSKANIIGRYVTNDQRGAMIQAELLEVDPVTGARLDYDDVAKKLEDQVRGRLKSEKAYDYKTRIDIGPYKAGDVVYRGYTDLGRSLRFAKIPAEKKNEDGTAITLAGTDVEVEAVANPDYAPNLDVHVVGFAKVVGDVISETQQVVTFFGITLVMTMVLLWLYVGSFKLAALPLVCSLTAVIWEFGLLRMFGFGLDPFAILVPFLILAVSVSHGVQYVNAWVGEIAHNGRNSFDASLTTWRRLAIYGTMAIMTDVAGFGTIYLIPIDIIREMSINASLGMLAIIITNKVMMPIWLTWVKIEDVKAFAETQERRDSIFDGLWRLIAKMTDFKPAVIALMICSVLLGWSLWKGKDLQVGDSQEGVPELLPDSRYNLDNKAIVDNFALGTDVIKVISETDADSCAMSQTMEQIDRLAWRLQNTAGVKSTLSLPQLSKIVYTAFSEGSPKFKVLARNKDAMIQAITPITPPTGMLNSNCSAMPIWTFTANHKATTIKRIVATVEDYNRENAAEFFETHKDVDSSYCEAKTSALREIGISRDRLQRQSELLHKRGLGDEAIAADASVVALTQGYEEAKTKYGEMTKVCPVHFALATGQVGVMAATNEVVEHLEKLVLLYVYIAIVICVYLSFFEWISIVSIMLPLALVSWMAYAVMAVLGIGMKVATLPVVALAVGIGVDYGIYVYATLADAVAGGYTLREGYFKTLKMTGKAVVFTGITLGFGVATWLLSGLQFQRDMGKLLVFMFTANMFGAILILPAIARFLLKERKLAPGEVPTLVSRH